ncbi:hypothetical protein RRG08_005936 [Elysia crispata]|uniref:Uncharacterized protein n=1 Tax=Elysia crispata TaxID=231223 RepID=A0AAE1AF35_9GAST|nr:hypothetical protein RRG08_005936 [Elysia crispata]
MTGHTSCQVSLTRHYPASGHVVRSESGRSSLSCRVSRSLELFKVCVAWAVGGCVVVSPRISTSRLMDESKTVNKHQGEQVPGDGICVETRSVCGCGVSTFALISRPEEGSVLAGSIPINGDGRK